MRSIVRSVLGAALVLVGAHAFAQTTGIVTGTVADEQGLVLPGATVELVSERTGAIRPTTSQSNGSFTLSAVDQGAYTLKVTLQGFQVTERRGIQLRSSETLNLGALTMRVGQFTEVSTVIAKSAVVQTGTATLSETLEAVQVDALVSRGRDPMDLVRRLPGVSVTGDGPTSLGGVNGTAMPNINGFAAGAVAISLDGMTTNDADTNVQVSTIGVDAIEEIKVNTTGYQAEYGRNAGATLSIVSKSGTNRFHGGYSYYTRHENLTANNYFNTLNSLPKPVFRYNTGSGTLGGPIGRPGRAGNRWFFFIAREDWKTSEPRAVTRSTMPTDLEKAGNFSQTVDTSGRTIFIRDPAIPGGTCNALTGAGNACFPGNIIPANRINAVGQAVLRMFPQPNFLDTSVSLRNYNYQYQDIGESRKVQNHVKVDFQTGPSRLSVLARSFTPRNYGYSGVFGMQSNWDQYRGNYAKIDHEVQGKFTRTFGTRWVNEVMASYRTARENFLDADFDALSLAGNGLAGLPQLYPGTNIHNLVPQVSFGGVTNGANVAYDARLPIREGDNRGSFTDTLTWAGAKHLVKAGFVYEYDNTSQSFAAACFAVCLAFGTSSTNPLNSNHAFANAALGNFLTYQQPNRRTAHGGVNDVEEGFIQDSWTPVRRVTLQLGLRVSSAHQYRVNTPFYGYPEDLADNGGRKEGSSFVLDRFDKARQVRLFRPATINGTRSGFDAVSGLVVPASLIGFIVPGSGDPFNGLVTLDDPLGAMGWREASGPQWQPRLGFAYDPWGDGKTAIRGSYGVTVQTLPASATFSNNYVGNAPYSVPSTITNSNLSTVSQSIGYTSPFGANGQKFTYKPQTAYNYSLGVQRNIGLSTVASVAYVGNRSRHIPLTQNINVVPPGARFNPANLDPTNNVTLPDDFLRPIVGYSNISIAEDTGISDYDSMQVTVNRRLTKGVSYNVAYTFSVAHNMEGTVPLYNDARSYMYDYSSFDQRHALSINYIWQLPNSRWRNSVVSAMLDGWQIAGTTFFGTGRPSGVGFTTTDSADILGGGDPGTIRVTCDPNLPKSERTITRWFDTSCFARPARGDEGNASRRAAIRLPGTASTDLGFTKTLVGRSQFRMQFRADLYNAFNQVIWTTVNTTARFDTTGAQVNAQFGQVTAAANPRVAQLGLRFLF